MRHAVLAVLFSTLAVALAGVSARHSQADDRLIFDSSSPAWLQAIGRLTVPGSRYTDGRREHFTEDCSATLVSRGEQQRSSIVLTAWHCLEKYSDLSKPIRFTLDPGGGPAIESEAYVLSDGGSIDADWALLKLHDPVSAERVAALIVAIDDIDAGRDLVMAGYSRDKGLGAGGDRLTYDPACQVTDSDKVSTTTNCIAHKGASGGPVIQHDSAGRPAVYGVISEGNGAGVSIFIPTRAFRQAVRTYL